MRLRQSTAEHGEVLAEDEDQAAVDHAVARDHAVAGDLVVLHAEVGAAVLDEHVPFFEGALVEQHLQALARAELALGVLRLDALGAAAQARTGALVFKLLQDVLHGCSPKESVEQREQLPRRGAGGQLPREHL